MLQFEIEKWIPKFITDDKNGYAMAKAIEAGLKIMNARIEEGVKCLFDYDSMPEWRLDELAWETNCLYDYNANIETKREWVRTAVPLYRLYGTPEAIYRYIGSYFDNVELEENWVYDGEPYHFRLTVDGEWTPDKEAWARKAVGTAKNVRSVLDALQIGSMSTLGISAEGMVAGRFIYPMTGMIDAGQHPDVAVLGRIDESTDLTIHASADEQVYQYPMAGTLVTQENGAFEQSEIQSAEADDTYIKTTYKLCGQDEF